MAKTNIELGEFNVDVTYKGDGKYDAYISHDGNSGDNHRDVTAKEIGEIVADFIDCITERYD